MAKPISVDLRERVRETVSEGLSRHQAAADNIVQAIINLGIDDNGQFFSYKSI